MCGEEPSTLLVLTRPTFSSQSFSLNISSSWYRLTTATASTCFVAVRMTTTTTLMLMMKRKNQFIEEKAKQHQNLLQDVTWKKFLSILSSNTISSYLDIPNFVSSVFNWVLFC
ncbi:hypothetical protein CHUAL_003823 [Chamberlinius hualienensis]